MGAVSWACFIGRKGRMGRKNIVDRPYFSDCRRFAEVINVMLYGGKRVVLPENLRLRQRRYPSMSGDSGEMERDILMEDVGGRVCYGIELETESDYSMPERIMVYDACDYEYQIKKLAQGHRDRKEYCSYREKKSRIKESDEILPMVTVVLYLGEGHWKGRRRLSQMCRGGEELGRLAGEGFYDYGFCLAEADYLNPEEYRTDLKEFFQAMQCRGDREKLRRLFRTDGFQRLGAETEHVIARHLHIKRLLYKVEKEELPMCKAFDELMREERQAGRKEGKREGKREGIKEERLLVIGRMIMKGFDEAQIRELTNCTRKELAAAAGNRLEGRG